MEKLKILIVDGTAQDQSELCRQLGGAQAVGASSLWRGLSLLARQPFDGVFVSRSHLHEALQAGGLLQSEVILDGLPDGVVLLDAERTVLWANAQMRAWTGSDAAVGRRFDELLPDVKCIAPVPCAFETALSRQETVSVTLWGKIPVGPDQVEPRYLRLQTTPIRERGEHGERAGHLVAVVRDVTIEVQQRQKLVAIHNAGAELADLTPGEVADMSVDDRISLLRENILRLTQDLLEFDVVEVRLLDRIGGSLEPLLSHGMQPLASQRKLVADELNNGVTGYVAATGKSYLCEDTSKDGLYLEGCKDGRSSLTVPLVLHDEVIGTFNVESPKPGAFNESDLLFLEIFARDVAQALHTLDLLIAEKASSTAKSVEAIHGAVALPIDTILNDACVVMGSYIGHDPELLERLQRILVNARDIRDVIREVGRKLSPAQALPAFGEAIDPVMQQKIAGKQVLVVDADESVRTQAHQLLERYGCTVETAHDGGEALHMARTGSYQAIISDIRLPDMSGYQLLLKLQEILDKVPLILMTGFGYDAGHSIVKARQAGLKTFLYKPFRLDKLLEALEQLQPLPGLAGSS